MEEQESAHFGSSGEFNFDDLFIYVHCMNNTVDNLLLTTTTSSSHRQLSLFQGWRTTTDPNPRSVEKALNCHFNLILDSWNYLEVSGTSLGVENRSKRLLVRFLGLS